MLGAGRLEALAEAFELSPLGMCVTEQGLVTLCNGELARMLGCRPPDVVGGSLAAWHCAPGQADVATFVGASGTLRGERLLRRADGSLFWCQLDCRGADPAPVIWVLQDLSSSRPVLPSLTGREHDIAGRLLGGGTSKEIARQVGISPRTVEGYRARLMKKLGATGQAQLVARLMDSGFRPARRQAPSVHGVQDESDWRRISQQ